MYTLHLGNSLEVLPTIETSSIDSIVCDPPYELGFMGSKWDATGIAYNVDLWREALRVLKPGGHLLAFSGSRTYHRMTCAIEDAGFEIRDQILWVYGSGFPKSLDVSKAIDKAAGAEREILSEKPASGIGQNGSAFNGHSEGATQKLDAGPATEAAKQWQGWGTALKPAHEPICVARKPLAKGLTVAANVLAHGTGALNIDECRVNPGETVPGGGASKRGVNGGGIYGNGQSAANAEPHTEGRWPANLIHDGSDEVLALFPETAPSPKSYIRNADGGSTGVSSLSGVGEKAGKLSLNFGDSGSAARFFYCAKTSKKDRNEGLEGFAKISPEDMTGRKRGSAGLVMEGGKANPYAGTSGEARANTHPTVKPTDLMRYLCRLVTPPGGIVLDPFMGSGSTGKAAMLEGFQFVGIEMEEAYHAIAKARIGDAHLTQFADML